MTGHRRLVGICTFHLNSSPFAFRRPVEGLSRWLRSRRGSVAMLDLRNRNQDVWPEALRPVGDGGFETEGFEAWSDRNRALIDHFHPQIAEQWLYRHCSSTRYRFLDIRQMSWREEIWTTADFMNSVHLEFGGPAIPDHDYEVFQKGGGWGPLPTARGWVNGSWDVPVVVLSPGRAFRISMPQLPRRDECRDDAPTPQRPSLNNLPRMRRGLACRRQGGRRLASIHEVGRPTLR